ncbi:AAA family ATPase [Pseudomonas poae]|uniref:AAA+ ATPase domain-containing protein n=1 Tax=Pseudomonas poae TaxID=200451 RepID=A0A2S9ETG5_9PSED|nr:AAA family ATPase [Pseudomonas poae]PRA27987.1 hypothetical protein CQZ97_16870 [Pseudomonas poae]PRC19091.1 hypothetical protein CQZ99_12340 [Pseudomonas poae]
MYYDTRELRSLSILKKIRRSPGLSAIPDKDFLYACAAVVSVLVLSGQPIAQDKDEAIRQIRHIRNRNHASGFSINDTIISLTHYALRPALKDLAAPELINLINYVIDVLIAHITGLDHRHCKIVSGFAGVIFDRARYDVVDVSPNIAHLTLGVRNQGIKYSFVMSGQIDSEQKKLLELKLHCNGIAARFAASIEVLPPPRDQRAYLIDALSQEAGLGELKTSINEMTSEEIYSQIPGHADASGFYILTRTSKGANAKAFKNSWSTYSQNIEAVVAFDSYHQGALRKFLFIIINNSSDPFSPTSRTLYINTCNNPAILSLDAIERSILSASIYLAWRTGDVPSPSGMSRKVASMLNSQFRNGYRDVNGLCAVGTRTRGYNRQLFNVNHHVNFAAHATATEDLNSAELHNTLASSHPTCLYIIGNNGAGKSLLLGRLAAELIEKENSATGITLSQSNRFPTSESSQYFTSFCLAQQSRHQLIATVPKLFSRICCDTKKLQTLLKCLERLSFTKEFYLGSKPHSKKRAIVDVESLIAVGDNALENQEVLRGVHLDSSTLVLVKHNDPDHYVFFSDLSSGEQNIITLLTLCIYSAGHDQTLLLDEPEISLHVSWQQQLPYILNIIAQDLHTSIVTATHSPLLISSAPLKHTRCYALDTGKLKHIEPMERRSVETSLVAIFGTYSPLNKEVYERCARLVALTIQKRNSESGVSVRELEDSLEQLKSLDALVKNSSVEKESARYDSDVDLIGKATLAIAAIRVEVEHESV